MSLINSTLPVWLTGSDATFYKNILFGETNIEALDIIVPSAASPTPCIINFHGGSFIFGDKTDVWDDAEKQAIVKQYVDDGICFISVNYRLISVINERTGVLSSFESAALAVQWVKFYADDFNIDKNNIALMGGSAGGGIAMSIAYDVDRADALNENYIRRESTSVVAVATNIAQASYDLQKWEDVIFLPLGYNLEDDYMLNRASRESLYRLYVISSLAAFYEAPSTIIRPKLDMLKMISDNGGIPTFLFYDNTFYDLVENGTIIDINHNDYHGLALKNALTAEGTEVIAYMYGLNDLDVSGETMQAFLRRKLGL
jgi:hypothetical protein